MQFLTCLGILQLTVMIAAKMESPCQQECSRSHGNLEMMTSFYLCNVRSNTTEVRSGSATTYEQGREKHNMRPKNG